MQHPTRRSPWWFRNQSSSKFSKLSSIVTQNRRSRRAVSGRLIWQDSDGRWVSLKFGCRFERPLCPPQLLSRLLSSYRGAIWCNNNNKEGLCIVPMDKRQTSDKHIIDSKNQNITGKQGQQSSPSKSTILDIKYALLSTLFHKNLPVPKNKLLCIPNHVKIPCHWVKVNHHGFHLTPSCVMVKANNNS